MLRKQHSRILKQNNLSQGSLALLGSKAHWPGLPWAPAAGRAGLSGLGLAGLEAVPLPWELPALGISPAWQARLSGSTLLGATLLLPRSQRQIWINMQQGARRSMAALALELLNADSAEDPPESGCWIKIVIQRDHFFAFRCL